MEAVSAWNRVELGAACKLQHECPLLACRQRVPETPPQRGPGALSKGKVPNPGLDPAPGGASTEGCTDSCLQMNLLPCTATSLSSLPAVPVARNAAGRQEAAEARLGGCEVQVVGALPSRSYQGHRARFHFDLSTFLLLLPE